MVVQSEQSLKQWHAPRRDLFISNITHKRSQVLTNAQKLIQVVNKMCGLRRGDDMFFTGFHVNSADIAKGHERYKALQVRFPTTANAQGLRLGLLLVFCITVNPQTQPPRLGLYFLTFVWQRVYIRGGGLLNRLLKYFFKHPRADVWHWECNASA